MNSITRLVQINAFNEEIRDKFYALIMSVSKRIQINKEKGKKIGKIEVAN